MGPVRYGKPYDLQGKLGKARGSGGLRETTIETLQLNSGSLSSRGVLEFKLELNEHEYARFLPNPFFLLYKIQVEVPEAGGSEDTGEAATQSIADAATDFVMDPTVQAAYTAFIEAQNKAASGSEEDKAALEAASKTLHEAMAAKDAAKTASGSDAAADGTGSGTPATGSGADGNKIWVNMVTDPSYESSHLNYITIPPDQGLSAIFHKVEVFLDGFLIGEDTDTSGHNCVYQALNRLFSSKKQRAMLDQPRQYLTSEDRAPDTATFKRATAKTTHLTKGGRDELLLGEFTFDGTFGLSPPRNFASLNLDNVGAGQNNRAFFPPHSSIVVRLHPREPWSALFDWCSIGAEALLDDEAYQGAELAVVRPLSLSLARIGMQYEKVVADRGSSPGSTRRGAVFEAPFIDKITLEQGHQQIRVTTRVPAGSTLVYFCFLKEHQMWYNPTLGKSLSNYFRFPEGLIKFSAALAGKGELFGKRGIRNLGGTLGYGSLDCRNYFQQIKNQGLVDFEFEDMFPSKKGVVPLCQVLLADLRPYKIARQSHIDVTLDFDGTRSPSTTKMLCCYVFSKRVQPADSGKSWKTQTITNF